MVTVVRAVAALTVLAAAFFAGFALSTSRSTHLFYALSESSDLSDARYNLKLLDSYDRGEKRLRVVLLSVAKSQLEPMPPPDISVWAHLAEPFRAKQANDLFADLEEQNRKARAELTKTVEQICSASPKTDSYKSVCAF